MTRKMFVILARALNAGIVALALVVTSQGAESGDQFKLRDFPPSPFEAKLSTNTWHDPDPTLQVAESHLELSAGTTNLAEMALIVEVKELKSKLIDLQATVDAKDPLRRVYGQYVEVAHDWVMNNHEREYGLASRYWHSDAGSSKRRILACVVDLIDTALFKQLASNTNFAPLLKSIFDVLERKQPGGLGVSYARNDVLIGFSPAAPPKPASTFEAYLAEIDQRYELVLTKLEQIQRAEGIPTEVITGWMYTNLDRRLSATAQAYPELTTPDELEKLRKQLRQKTDELSRLRALSR